jgi:putative ABC transport system permease protein
MRQWRASIGDRRNPSDGDVSWVAKPRTIVGVVGDVHLDRLDLEAKPELYVPFTQIPNTEGRPTIVVRTAIDPAAVTAALRNAVSGIDNALPLDQVKSMQQLVSASVGQPRFRTIPLAPFSILALVIASVGIYGLMNYRVSQQIREFGIRLAIGEGDVLRLVLRRATVLIAAGLGLGVGLLGSAMLARLITGLLHGVDAWDPLTFAAVSLLLSAVALLASYIPARRATRVDPLTALRYE